MLGDEVSRAPQPAVRTDVTGRRNVPVIKHRHVAVDRRVELPQAEFGFKGVLGVGVGVDPLLAQYVHEHGLTLVSFSDGDRFTVR